MRIRKNAKISTLLYSNPNLIASNNSNECLVQQKKNLCQLNQSPWDIITNFHQLGDYEVYFDVNYAGNGSSIDPIDDFERKITSGDNVGLVKTVEGESYNLDDPKKNDPKNNDKEILGFENDQQMTQVQEEMLLCDVTDKKGWQCGRVVTTGETMCDRHIELQNRAVWTTKKKSRPAHDSVAGTRSRQTKKQASTSPHEFYYYSGFGPSWGKKRGTGTESTFSNTCNEPEPEPNKVVSEDGMVMETRSSNSRKGRSEPPEASTERPLKMGSVDVDEADDSKTGKTDKKRGKKRGRKPIKARSLKSLM